MIKVNLYTAFESEEEKSMMALQELIKWPDDEFRVIPEEKERLENQLPGFPKEKFEK